MQIPGKQIMINPVETNRNVTGGIGTPNVAGSFGSERKFSDIMEQNILKYNYLKLEEYNQTAEAFKLGILQDGQDMELALKTNPDSYKKPDMFNEYAQRTKDRQTEFEKIAKEKGIPQDLVNAALESSKRSFAQTQAVYGKYQTDYLEEESRKRNILLFDEQSSLASKTFLNGNFGEGMALYQANQKKLREGFDKGYITADQYVKMSNAEKQNSIFSFVYSKVNSETGEQELAEMMKFNPEQFEELFKELNGKYEDFDIMLNADDYSFFQRSIGGALSAVNTRKNANEQKTMLDVAKAEKELRDNPVDKALDMFPAGTPLNEVAESFTVMATNFKLGTNFKTTQEIIDNGYAPVTIQGKNSRATQYMDVNLGAAEYMQTRLTEALDYVGGLPIEQQVAILDEQYNDGTANYIMGYNGTYLYGQGNTYVRYLYDRLYTAENKQSLAKMGNIEADWLSAFGMYADEFQGVTSVTHNINTMLPGQMLRNPYTGSEGIYERKGEYTETSLGGKIYGLRLAGINGDKHAARLAKDCMELIKNTTILAVMSEDGGLISEDIAEEVKLEKYIGQPIEVLNPEQKNKYFNAYLEDPGRVKKLFGGENPIKKQVREQLTGALRELTAEVQTVDVGNGRFLNVRHDIDAKTVSQRMNYTLQNNEFYTKQGLIAPSKEIKLVGKIGTDDVLLFYNNEPLLDSQGNRAVINIGGLTNE